MECDSYINILETDTDDNDNSEPQIICHSHYYDSNKFTETLTIRKNKFSILSTNIQSINAKIYKLRIFIENLNTSNFAFSAICIQETWLSENDDLSQIHLDDYKCIPLGKSCSTKSGLIIYLHDQFEYMYKSKLTYNTWEGQIIQVKKGNNLNKPINIGNIYRPPKDIIEKYIEFIDEFTPILNTLEANSNDVIIAGHFNIDLLKVNDKHVFSDYFDMLTSHSFYPNITLPTTLSNNNGTLIANFLCKLTESTLETTSGILINKLF